MPESELNHHGPVLLPGKIVCNYGQSVTDCVVCKISDRGATVQIDSSIGFPEHFHLLISGHGGPRPCKLVWQSGKELGLEFEQPDAASDDAHAAPEHPERRSLSTLSGQTLALRAALDEIQNGVLLLGHDLRAQFINRALRKMWNVPDALADSKPAFVALLYYCRDNNAYQAEPGDLDAFIAQRIRLVRAGDTTPIDLRRSDGEVIRVQVTVLPNGGRLLTYTLVTDIVRHADELEVLRSALDNVQDGVLLLDANLNAQFLNRKMREYWGVTEQQAAAHPAYPRMIAKALNAGADAPAAPGQLCEFFSEQDAAAHISDTSARDVRIPDGRHIRVHCAKLPNGSRMFTYCDVTDLIRNAQQLEKLATIDSMTNLYNRRHFLTLAEAEWSRSQRHRRPLSVLMIDIDHFKAVNDRYGHAVGDEAIVSIASACREGKRGEDFAGRLGGEEFAVMLPETDQTQATVLAERIRERVANHTLTTQRVQFKVTISIGIAAATEGMAGLDVLLRAADQALYQAKAGGRNCTVHWVPPLAAE
jgi:diguanylate cyclase (GGDEF)-like protein